MRIMNILTTFSIVSILFFFNITYTCSLCSKTPTEQANSVKVRQPSDRDNVQQKSTNAEGNHNNSSSTQKKDS